MGVVKVKSNNPKTWRESSHCIYLQTVTMMKRWRRMLTGGIQALNEALPKTMKSPKLMHKSGV